jgi:hypothetical protein
MGWLAFVLLSMSVFLAHTVVYYTIQGGKLTGLQLSE